MGQALKFTIGGDANPFVAAMRVVEKVASQTGAATASQLRKAEKEILAAASATDLTVRQTNFYAQSLARIQSEILKVDSAQRAATASATAFAAAQARVALGRGTAADKALLAANMARVPDETVNPFAGNTPRGAGQSAGMLGAALSFGKRIVAPFAGVYAAYKVKDVIADSVQADISLRRIENTFKVITGSAEKAVEEMVFLRREADRVGTSFEGLAGSSGSFTSAASEAGISPDKTRLMISSIAQLGAVLGLSTERQKEAMLAWEQMLSRGSVMSQELRLQWGNAIPGGLAIFAKALGVTNGELLKMVENGQVLSSEVLPKVAEYITKNYPLTEDANKEARDIARLKNEIFTAKAELGNLLRPVTSASLSFLTKELIGLRSLARGDIINWFGDDSESVESNTRIKILQKQLNLMQEMKKAVNAGFEFKPMLPFGATPEEKKILDKDKESRDLQAARLNSETADIRDKISLSGLTEEERKAEMVRRRAEYEKTITELQERQAKGQNNVLDIAMYQNRIAKIDEELARDDKPRRAGNHKTAISSDSLVSVGNFLGTSKSMIESIAQRQVDLLSRIELNTRARTGGSDTIFAPN